MTYRQNFLGFKTSHLRCEVKMGNQAMSFIAIRLSEGNTWEILSKTGKFHRGRGGGKVEEFANHINLKLCKQNFNE